MPPQVVVTDPKDPRFGLSLTMTAGETDTDPKSPTFGQSKATKPIDQAGEAWQAVKDLITGTLKTVSAFGDPMKSAELGQGIINAHINEFKKGQQSLSAGHPVEAFGHTLASVVPVVGPMVAQPVEDLASGHYGRAGVNIGAMVAPSVAGKIPALRIGGLAEANPLTRAAVDFGLREGIPVDAATSTGNAGIRAAQHLSDRTIGGGMVAGSARAAQADALAATGNRLASRANVAGPMTPEAAGEAALGSVEGRIAAQHATANTQYSKLRAFEADPKYSVSVPGSQEEMPLAVDLRGPKTALKPIYDRLMKEREIAGTLNGAKAKAAVALDTLMQAPDHAPLSVVDGALSDLKGLARGADMPELRSMAQGTASAAVKQLDAAVRSAATRGGPEVLQALEEGRLATVGKYVAADVRDRLVGNSQNPEPVRIFNRLIARDDTSVTLLRDLRTQAPGTIQNIGRAVVDQLVGEATADGGFKKAATIANKWDALGDATKETLFPDAAHRADLDNFFRLARRMADNPNPSGTAHTLLTASQGGLILTEPVSGVALQLGTAALSKILHSPATSRLLLRGLTIPVSNRVVAASLIPGLLKAAGKDAIPMNLPAFASQPQQAPSIK